ESPLRDHMRAVEAETGIVAVAAPPGIRRKSAGTAMTLAPTGSQAARKLFAPLAWRFIDFATVVVPPCSSGVRYEKRSSISVGPTFKAYEVSWRLGGEGSPGSPGVTLQPDNGSPALTATAVRLGYAYSVVATAILWGVLAGCQESM